MTTLEKREFAGYLMGEGCFRLSYRNKWANGRKEFRPQVILAQRADDGEILKLAKQEYGGSLILRPGRPQIPNQNPHYTWNLENGPGVLRVIDDFLKSSLPSKKKIQARIVREICIIKAKKRKQGHKGMQRNWYTEEEYQKQVSVYEELKQLKLYNTT